MRISAPGTPDAGEGSDRRGRASEERARIRADFDRIARLPPDRYDHNALYHRYLLHQLPASPETALDLGCGTGEFSRLLAARAGRVVGVDLSSEMVRVARERSRHLPNVSFAVADAAEWPFRERTFDAVAAIATLHHLPLEETLLLLRRSLRPGGTLLVLDLFDGSGILDRLPDAMTVPVDRFLRLVVTGRLRPPAIVRRAWQEHGRHDRYPRLPEVRDVCRRLLPGARVRRHVFWRYSIVWREPAPDGTASRGDPVRGRSGRPAVPGGRLDA